MDGLPGWTGFITMKFSEDLDFWLNLAAIPELSCSSALGTGGTLPPGCYFAQLPDMHCLNPALQGLGNHLFGLRSCL